MSASDLSFGPWAANETAMLVRPSFVPALFVPAFFVAMACSACRGAEPPAPAAPIATAASPSAPTVSSASPPVILAPAEPTPDQKKSAEALRDLQEDRAKWQRDNEAELSRWTPELHRASKSLAEKTYPSGRAAIQAATLGKHRKPGNAERDKYRHPLETLGLFGFKPTMTVLEVSPGDGWYTEILAPALAANGKLIATSADPNGPPDQRSTFYAQRFQAFLGKAPEVYGKVKTITVDGKAPSLDLDGKVDLALVMREVHGMVNSGTLDVWLAAIHRALKPGGVLGIEEHRAPADADPKESAKRGYVPEKWLIDRIEAAGFTLAGKSELNANPKDTKDYPGGVWTLPPSFAEKDKDHAKYAAIGESDRMTLKFAKAPEPNDVDGRAKK